MLNFSGVNTLHFWINLNFTCLGHLFCLGIWCFDPMDLKTRIQEDHENPISCVGAKMASDFPHGIHNFQGTESFQMTNKPYHTFPLGSPSGMMMMMMMMMASFSPIMFMQTTFGVTSAWHSCLKKRALPSAS